MSGATSVYMCHIWFYAINGSLGPGKTMYFHVFSGKKWQMTSDLSGHAQFPLYIFRVKWYV